MITVRKRFMTYTLFSRNPQQDFSQTHLFAMVKKSLAMMTCVPFPTIYVDLTNPNFISAWSSSTRTKINKAGSDDLTVERGDFLMEEVLKLFMRTAKRKGLRGYRINDFAAYPEMEVSAVFKDGVILCGHIWVVDREEKRALLFVNASDHSDVADKASLIGRAHYFLLWQDGLLLHQKGIEKMDLMGFDPNAKNEQLKGVYQWKAATHGTPEVLYHYYPIWFFILRKFRNMLTG